MALIPVFFTASTKEIAVKSHEQGILKYPGFCFIEDIETIVYVSSDNELHYIKGDSQVTEIKFEDSKLNFYFNNSLISSVNIVDELRKDIGLEKGTVSEIIDTKILPKANKVIDAVQGHLSSLNEDGDLIDSGKSIIDFEEAGSVQAAKNETLKYIGTLSDEYQDIVSYIKSVADNSDSKGSANQSLVDAKAYTDERISSLINGAPETADTLKELSDLVSNNKDIIDSLNTLVSKKADMEETNNAIETINNKTLTVDPDGILIFK